MSQIHIINSAAFFGPSSNCEEFKGMQLAAMQSGCDLEAFMYDDHVRLALVSPDGRQGIELAGDWRSPDFEGAKLDNVGVKVMLPFLFRISAVILPVRQMFTCGESYRSPADFFMRNVFLGACRNAPMTCTAHDTDGSVNGNRHNLQRQYFFIIKSFFDEVEFDVRTTDEVIDFLGANAYLSVLEFSNPLLRHGCQELRDMHALAGDYIDVSQEISQLKSVQASLKPHL